MILEGMWSNSLRKEWNEVAVMAEAMTETIKQALEPISKSLQADGYELVVNSFEEGVLSVEIQAGPKACVECLVPKELMEVMIQQSVKTLARSVHVRYPTSQDHHG